jgi:hypothetical protein
MLASKHFQINRLDEDDWFDAILDVDTNLFMDPSMVFQDKAGFWAGAHDELVKHFDRAFILIAQGNRDSTTLPYKKALDILEFPEPRELCLGYTAQGTRGAGSGAGYAELIARAITEAISRGLEHPRHFEELGIHNEGIGADRISDITATVLKHRLIEYTRNIATQHKIPVAPHKVIAAGFDEMRQRWKVDEVYLPTNPATGGPYVFVPLRFLRKLPVLNANDWWNDYENEKLRQDLNYEILGRVKKTEILKAARAAPEAVRHGTIQKEQQTAPSYDLLRDPAGVYQWHEAAALFVRQYPIILPVAKDTDSFKKVIQDVIEQFRLFIEDQGGWRLLWDAGLKEKPEGAAQLLFFGIARNYCRANNISVDREVDLGRGSVDFKFSNGYSNRAHLEVKKLRNGKFWSGLNAQLPTYMRGDEVELGWFLALRFRSSREEEKREQELPQRVRDVAKDKGLELYPALIDVRPKVSASQL